MRGEGLRGGSFLILGTAPSESLQSILKETAVSLSMRPGTAKRLRSKIIQAFPLRRYDHDPFVTEAEFFQALSGPPVFNAREVGGMLDAVVRDASGRTWDDTLRRKLAMQGAPPQLEHYAQSMRENLMEQMRPEEAKATAGNRSGLRRRKRPQGTDEA